MIEANEAILSTMIEVFAQQTYVMPEYVRL